MFIVHTHFTVRQFVQTEKRFTSSMDTIQYFQMIWNTNVYVYSMQLQCGVHVVLD